MDRARRGTLSLSIPQVLIRADLPVPESVCFEPKQVSPHWNLMKEAEPGELQQKLHEADWRCRRIPTKVVAAGMAGDLEQAWREAIEDLFACTREPGLDAVEIGQVRIKKIGWLYYALVQGHPWLLEAASARPAAKEAASQEAA